MQIPANLNPYWLLLKDLSSAEKLSLIELLVKSIKNKQFARKHKNDRPQIEKDDWVLHFAGSWSDFPETAEEMIALLEGARTMGRTIEQI